MEKISMSRRDDRERKGKFQIALAWRFAGLQLALALFIMLAIGALGYRVMSKLIEENYRNRLYETLSAVSSITQNFIDSSSRQLHLLMDEKVFEKYTRSFNELILLTHFQHFKKNFEKVVYSDQDESEVIIFDQSSGQIEYGNTAVTNLFIRCKEKPNTFFLSTLADSSDAAPVIWMGEGMVNYFGEHLGYVAVQIPLANLNQCLAQFTIPKDVRTVIADRNGQVLYDSQEKWVGESLKENYFPQSDKDEAKRKRYVLRTSFLDCPDCIMTAGTLSDHGWQLFNLVQYKNYTKPLHAFWNKIAGILFAVSLLTIGIIMAFGHYLIKPIRLLTKTAHQIASSGDLKRSVQWCSKDEIGDLAESFNLMIKRLQAAQNEIIEERANLENILLSIPDTTIVTDENNAIIRANHALYGLLGYKEKEILGHNVLDIVAPDQEKLKDVIEKDLKEKKHFKSFDSVLVSKNSQRIFVTISGALLKASDGRVAGSVFVAKDITKLKQAHIRLTHLANHDSLTGLPNRMALTEQLTRILKRINRHQRLVAVMFIDLDRFKLVNDTLGHSAGDQLIKEMASRLNSSIRDDDIVARLGGDEFVVVLNDVASIEDIKIIAGKILDTFRESVDLNGHAYTATGSIGISIAPDHGHDAETLMKNADMAMYTAKWKGRNNYQVYFPDMHIDTRSVFHMEVAMRKALEEKEYKVFFQPVVDADTLQIIGAEALVRWEKKDGSLYSPLEFLPIAEETGLILPLGRWIMETGFAMSGKLQKAGFPHFSLAVNISDRQFRDPDLPDIIQELLKQTGFSAENLNLELTEGILMQDIDRANKTLIRLKELGLSISVDDFGTGYSSLAHLKRFPLDVLKIDRSFVAGLPGDRHDCALVKAIIGLAHILELEIVAEGVETREQSTFLKLNGVDMLQGFFFSRALPSDELHALLLSTKTLPAG